MKNILFPTDFSSCARNALDYAITLAAVYQSKIILYHAYTIPLPPAEFSAYMDEEAMAIIRKEASRKLSLWRAIVEESGLAIECVTRLEPGPVEHSLLRYAREAEVDEIIMGTEGAKGLRKIFLGSRAARIVTEADCPVMIVPDGQKFEGIHKMVFATNYQDENLQTMKTLMDLVTRFKAELTIVHCATADEDFSKEIFTWYKSVVKEDYPGVPISFKLLRNKSVNKALETYMEESKSDLLVMLNRKKGIWEKLFIESHSQKMALHAENVVLVFHPDGKKVSEAV